MTGLAGSPIREVVFEKCSIKAMESGLALRNVENIDLSGLIVAVPERGEAPSAADTTSDRLWAFPFSNRSLINHPRRDCPYFPCFWLP